MEPLEDGELNSIEVQVTSAMNKTEVVGSVIDHHKTRRAEAMHRRATGPRRAQRVQGPKGSVNHNHTGILNTPQHNYMPCLNTYTKLTFSCRQKNRKTNLSQL